MPFYRGQVSGGGQYTQADIDSYYIESEGVKYRVGETPFANNQVFNAPINVGDNVMTLGDLCRGANNFNAPITFGNNIKNAYAMVFNCKNFNRPITIPDGVQVIGAMFQYADNFNQPINIPNSVVSANQLFYAASPNMSNFNSPVSWNLDNPMNLAGMFQRCSNFNQPINIGNNKNCYSMLEGCTNFNSPINIGVNCYLSRLLYMGGSGPFNSFNQPIPNIIAPINVSNMFNYCEGFNHPINIIDGGDLHAQGMLSGCANFNSNVNFVNCNSINAYMFMGWRNPNFNAYVNWGNAYITDIRDGFCNCHNFNKPIDLSRIIGNAAQALQFCDVFNQPLNVATESVGLNNIGCYSLLNNSQNFNSPIVFGESVYNVVWALQYCKNFGSSIYFKGNQWRQIAITGLLGFTNNSLRKNVHFNSVLNNVFNRTDGQSIVVNAISWTPMTNGFYNQQYNIYCYNNYAG